MPARRVKKRVLGGVPFACIRPGLWISGDRHLAVVKLDGSWELYQTGKSKEPSLYAMNQGWFAWATSRKLASRTLMRGLAPDVRGGGRRGADHAHHA